MPLVDFRHPLPDERLAGIENRQIGVGSESPERCPAVGLLIVGTDLQIGRFVSMCQVHVGPSRIHVRLSRQDVRAGASKSPGNLLRIGRHGFPLACVLGLRRGGCGPKLKVRQIATKRERHRKREIELPAQVQKGGLIVRLHRVLAAEARVDSKKLRTGKIYLDYQRNQYGATAVAPYATRAKPGAPISLPLTWQELSRTTGGDQFRLHDVPPRAVEDRHRRRLAVLPLMGELQRLHQQDVVRGGASGSIRQARIRCDLNLHPGIEGIRLRNPECPEADPFRLTGRN